MDGAFGVNLITILIAAIASFAFGAAYYMSLAKPWMKAIGITQEQVEANNSPIPYILAFIAGFIIAYMLAVLLVHTSKGTITLSGALFGAFSIWLGFIATTLTVNHRYGLKPWSLTIIDGGHWLGVMLIQAIVMTYMGL